MFITSCRVRKLKTYFHVVAEVVGHDAPDYVEADVASRMAHVRLVVNGRSAGVPGDLVGIDRHKLILLVGEGVENS
jgi:hypothetical protein